MIVTPAPTTPTTKGAVFRNASTIGMVWQRELIRLRRAPSRIVAGLAQPIIFLFVIGSAFNRLIPSDAAGIDYQEFLFPGILSMSIITSSLFASISVVWDREFGFMREMLVAPVSRASIVFGKALGGGTVAVAQGLILIVAAPIVGVTLTPVRVVGLVVALLLLAYALTSLGMVLATRMQRMESFQMVMSLVLQPMIFLSGAVFPLSDLPGWLAFLTRINPASYGVDLVRRVTLEDAPALTLGGEPVPLWLDAVVVLGLGSALMALAVRLFQRTD